MITPLKPRLAMYVCLPVHAVLLTIKGFSDHNTTCENISVSIPDNSVASELSMVSSFFISVRQKKHARHLLGEGRGSLTNVQKIGTISNIPHLFQLSPHSAINILGHVGLIKLCGHSSYLSGISYSKTW